MSQIKINFSIKIIPTIIAPRIQNSCDNTTVITEIIVAQLIYLIRECRKTNDLINFNVNESFVVYFFYYSSIHEKKSPVHLSLQIFGRQMFFLAHSL